jgi:SAM-dependent methyltransferase
VGTVEENREYWSTYAWPEGGDEWSEVWGGTRNLWWGTLFPRIVDYLPAGTGLEIGPGFGRFTRDLRQYCDRLVLVDLTKRCIDECRERFGDDPHLSFHVNDGRTLPMVDDGSVDFAFSFDSLVHAEADAVESYVEDLGRKLTPDGVAFLHHSNVGSHTDPVTGRVTIDNHHWRAESVSADLVVEAARRASLVCIAQEIVNWGTDQLTDCLSVLTPAGSRLARPLVRRDNPEFMAEAFRVAALGELYAAEATASD